MNLPAETSEQIQEALFAGKKIQAIKLYRAATNEGLKEAKDAVERMESELRASSPEKFRTAAGKSAGCLSVLLAAGIALLGLAWAATS